MHSVGNDAESGTSKASTSLPGVRLLTDGGAEEDAEEQNSDDEAEEDQEEADTEEDQEDQEDQEGEEGEEEGATVLFLDLEGLFLNLLGLEVDLNEVVIDVTAVPGENRLVGNLLSAVSGLLDGGGLDDLLGGSLLGSLMGGGDSDGDSNGMISGMSDKIRNELGEIVEDLPIEELLTNFFKELITQLFSDPSDAGENEAES